MINLPKPSVLQNGIDANSKVSYILSYLSKLVTALETELRGYSNQNAVASANATVKGVGIKNGEIIVSYDDGTTQTLKEEQKILWEGAEFMDENTEIDLTDKEISNQKNGIVLVFSAYLNGAAQDYFWHSFFVPKKFIEMHSGNGSNFPMFASDFSIAGNKYLYITDKKITGNANNTVAGQVTWQGSSGIAYNNARWVLRYVIGV